MPDEQSDAEALRAENERLESEVEELRHSSGGSSTGKKTGRKPKRFRRISAWVVLVLACILAVVSVLVVFVRNEALNTDTYVATVAPLAKDPAVQQAVANRISNALLSRVDVKQQIQQVLPAKAGILAGPITSGVDTAVHTVALKAVQSDQFATAWTEINRHAHQQVVNLLTGQTKGAVSSTNGEVTLDLGKVATQVKERLDAQGITVLNKVNTGNGPTLVLFKSDQLAKYQKLIKHLNQLALILPIVTILLFIGSVLLALNRRKGFVRATAGLAVSMALLLISFDIGRNQYLHALPKGTVVAAASDAYDIVTAPPLTAIRIVLAVALVACLIAIAAGSTWVRTHLAGGRSPSWLRDSPFLRFVSTFRHAIEWVVAGIGLLVLIAWNNPSPLVVIVVALVTVAVIALIVAVAKPRGPQPALAGAGPAPSHTNQE
jgi:hypothetical protein